MRYAHSSSVVRGLVGWFTEIGGKPVVSGEGTIRGTMSSLVKGVIIHILGASARTSEGYEYDISRKG